MIALAGGFAFVGITASCITAILRLRGVVAFALGVAVLSFAEIVAVSHALSFVDAYERGSFLVAVGIVAAAAVLLTAVVRPRRPDLARAGVVRDLARDPVIAVLGAVVASSPPSSSTSSLSPSSRHRRSTTPSRTT